MARMGRPPLFESVEEFEERAEAYFLANDGGKISWTGLCLAVGANSRQALDRYKNGDHGKDFVCSVKMALTIVENYYEEKGEGAMGIFALKNFGWKDKLDVAHEGALVVGDYKVSSDMTPKEAAKAFKEQIKDA